MIALSFRIKLLLAMMLLVAGVTGATLYVTQQKVQQTYLKLFQDQFETEVNYFTVQQESRLNPVKDRCQELAKSTAFQETLVSGDPAKIYEAAANFFTPSNQPNVRNIRAGARGNLAAAAGVTQLLRN